MKFTPNWRNIHINLRGSQTWKHSIIKQIRRRSSYTCSSVLIVKPSSPVSAIDAEKSHFCVFDRPEQIVMECIWYKFSVRVGIQIQFECQLVQYDESSCVYNLIKADLWKFSYIYLQSYLHRDGQIYFLIDNCGEDRVEYWTLEDGEAGGAESGGGWGRLQAGAVQEVSLLPVRPHHLLPGPDGQPPHPHPQVTPVLRLMVCVWSRMNDVYTRLVHPPNLITAMYAILASNINARFWPAETQVKVRGGWVQ